MPIKKLFHKKAQEHIKVIDDLIQDKAFLHTLSGCANLIVNAYKSGNKLLLCGNGGSASDSQHIAAELVGRFYKERKALNAESLTLNTSSLTAIGNDYTFDMIFARQVEAKGKQGDVLIGLSTSGNSRNVYEAFKKAKELGIATISMTGNNSDSLIAKNSDYSIQVPSKDTPRIQEAHIFIGHVLCEYIENALFKER